MKISLCMLVAGSAHKLLSVNQHIPRPNPSSLAPSLAPAILPNSSDPNQTGQFPIDAAQPFQTRPGVSGMSDGNSDVPSTYNLSSNFHPSMTVAVAVLLSAFILMFVLYVFMKKCGTANNTDANDSRRAAVVRGRGLDRAVVENLPLVEFLSLKVSNRSITDALNEGKGTMECVVCLSEFQEYEILRLLPVCEHCFHQECIDMWLFTHTTCPLCRSSLLPEKVISVPETTSPTSSAAAGEPVPSARGIANEAIYIVPTTTPVDLDPATATHASD